MVTPAPAHAGKTKKAAAVEKKPAAIGHSSINDSQVKLAFEEFYSLDYDKAIANFEKFADAHPDDPFAVNHLFQAVLFKELYRLNLLDTTLYAHDGFFSGNKTVVGDPTVRARIDKLAQLAFSLAETRLKANPNDVDALYARGVTRGLRSTYMALVDRSFFAALRNAVGARSDHEKVLQLDSNYADAKTVVGAHNYVVGSLPLPVKMLAGVAGIGGNRKKGLEYLAEAGKSGTESSVDARVALALFLRREARYDDAHQVVEGLVSEHPHNFLFALENCNLLKDGGKGLAAVDAYRKLVADGGSGQYPQAHIELADFGLAESLRGQKDYLGAYQAYEKAAAVPNAQPGMKQRAELGAGEMLDTMQKREDALKLYQGVIAADSNTPQAEMARKLLKSPYRPE
jgi:tetratricopeptide (TPR) repeat protein